MQTHVIVHVGVVRSTMADTAAARSTAVVPTSRAVRSGVHARRGATDGRMHSGVDVTLPASSHYSLPMPVSVQHHVSPRQNPTMPVDTPTVACPKLHTSPLQPAPSYPLLLVLRIIAIQSCVPCRAAVLQRSLVSMTCTCCELASCGGP